MTPDEGMTAENDRDRAEIILVSGMSGAGRSTAADVLEDEGWFVIDNLPPQLLVPTTDLLIMESAKLGHSLRAAAVVDVRTRTFFSHLFDALDVMDQRGLSPLLIFLDATDEALVRRFESVRRPHPLQGDGRLLDGIHKERELLRRLRERADLVIDTSGINVHQLAQKLKPAFRSRTAPNQRVAVMSFGFKYGIPLDADYVFDLRFLPNPFWVPELRAASGRDPAVAEFVMTQEGAEEFIEHAEEMLRAALAGHRRQDRRYVTICLGCTGGKHRSVAIAERLAAELAEPDIETFVVHRDLGRE